MDRLNELRTGLILENSGTSNPVAAPNEETTFLKDFFQQLEVIRLHYNNISKSTEEINGLHHAMEISSSFENENEINSRLQLITSNTNKGLKLCKNLLKKLQIERDQPRYNKVEKKIMVNSISSMTKKFVDIANKYQSSQMKFKEEIRKKMTRQILIASPDATNEQIDNIIRSNQSSRAVSEFILHGNANQSIQNAYEIVQEKYKNVENLEASINELTDIMIDFSKLVTIQGEALDRIEEYVQTADEEVGLANENLVDSIQKMKSTRKFQCIVFLIILIIIGIILGIVLSKKFS